MPSGAHVGSRGGGNSWPGTASAIAAPINRCSGNAARSHVAVPTRPPGRTTRASSLAPASTSGKNISPNIDSAASNVSSANSRC